jgi:hypothetical protein
MHASCIKLIKTAVLVLLPESKILNEGEEFNLLSFTIRSARVTNSTCVVSHVHGINND